ncbi:MAG TPA: HAMP domain-containing sensor histidine kinase [Candidatus Anoxymicrobiaceae bacterium]|jgi:two-component system, OmpR family, sensor histidine kinase CiaH
MIGKLGNVRRLVEEKLPGAQGRGESGLTTVYIRLTLWYVLTIMVVSATFSVVVYVAAAREIDRSVGKSATAGSGSLADKLISEKLQHETAKEAKGHFALILVMLNAGVLIVAAGLSYRIAVNEIEPIKEALEMQSQFTADASHELRTPLAAMKAEIEVALRGREPDAQESRRLLESNLEEIDKLTTLSDSLLKLSRYDHGVSDSPSPSRGGGRGGAEINGDKCSVERLIHDSIGRVQRLADARDISIKTDVEETSVPGDRDSLVELLVILLDNSVKYSDEHTEISVSSQRERNSVILKVRDQGIGIEASDLSRILERFYRVESSRSRDKAPGFGLGLSIARKIVDAHRGSLEFASTPGQGTTVTVKLPL